MKFKFKKWHWRDILCWIRLHVWGLSKGYTLKQFCGDCKKCNGLFGYCGCIPCPLRFPIDGSDYTKKEPDETPSLWGSPKEGE